MNKKICIIGAGAAGIAAGTKLLKNGFSNILILEAENRIGGRIRTIPFAKNVVDLGAQWCHGEKDNVVYEMASKFCLFDSTTTKYDRFTFIRSDGEIINEDIGNKLMGLAMSIIEDYREELRTYQGSLGNFIVDKFSKLIQGPDFRNFDGELLEQFLDFFHRYENSIEASDTWFDSSAEGYWQYFDCEGDRLLNWKDKGYKTILDIMMEKFPDPSKSLKLEDKIVFNKKVEKINWTSPEFVKIYCKDGSSYIVDHVIVTLSLGVLKESYLSLFEPQLPILKKNAIQGLGFGTVDKIYLEFTDAFWPNDWTGFSLLWNAKDLQQIRRSKNPWLQDVFGFYVVDYQPNILCGWISGVYARQMEMIEEAEVLRGCTMLLRKFLKDMQVPDPIRMERSTWFTNANFRGSYSFRSVKTDLLDTSADDLAFPLTNALGVPVLQFAGEATHPHYFSTVHGAIGSGWREANRIINLYKHGDETKIPTDLDLKKTPKTPPLKRLESQVDVLILGAGIAGLGAAYQLKDSEKLFLLLEAQERPGGRLDNRYMTNERGEIEKDLQPEDRLVNAGAQWLHGKQNLLYNIAEKNDLLLDKGSEEGKGVYVREDGTEIDDFFVRKVDFVVGQILEECEEFIERPKKGYPKSLEPFLLRNFKNFVNGLEEEEEKIQALQLLDWHMRFQIIDNSCYRASQISAKSWGTYSFNGESCQAHINFRNGFAQIVDHLLDEIGRDRLKLKKEVTNISWGSMDGKDGRPKVFVSCSDGTTHVANHIIVTFSLGVLKEQAERLFSPRIPRNHLQAIECIGFGPINKIFLQFKDNWWGNLKGFQLIYESSHYQVSNWTRYLSGFDLLEPGPPNTLLGWVGGHGAIEMEKLSNDQIVQDCIKLLTKFTRIPVPEPQNYFCTRWHSNRFVRGAYSYASAACDKENITPKQLATPIRYGDLHFSAAKTSDAQILISIRNLFVANDVEEEENEEEENGYLDETPLILFAGEACHEKYYSTVHGAFLSGVGQASRILDFYEKS